MRRTNRGATMMELLIVAVLTSFFIAMIGSAVNGVNAMWQTVMGTNPVIAEQRKAVDMLMEHLRNAQGCKVSTNPYYKLAIVSAGSTSITYVSDKDTCSTVRYFLSGSNLMRQESGGTAKTVVGNVSGLTWTYYKSPSYFGTWSTTATPSAPTSSELPLLCGLKLRLTSSIGGKSLASDTTVRLRNSPQKTRLDGL